MKSKGDVQHAIKNFFKTVGFLPSIIAKFVGEQVQGEEQLFWAGLWNIWQLEKIMPWYNFAEWCVDIFKKATTKDLKAYNEPLALWLFCAERLSKTIINTACDNYHLNSHTPHTLMTGEQTDISAICDLGWYAWWYYWYQDAKLPNNTERLGRVLGPADHYCTAMYQWVMNENGTILQG